MYPLRICLRNPKIETKLLLLFFYSGLAFILMRMCKNKYLWNVDTILTEKNFSTTLFEIRPDITKHLLC